MEGRAIFFARPTSAVFLFSKNMQVTTAPTSETCCGAQLHDQYGDYEGIAAMDGSVHPVWSGRPAAVASLDERPPTTAGTTRSTWSSSLSRPVAAR
jgi:hypothetical protein